LVSTESGSVGFSLVASASWGAGDFCGGVAARRTSVFGVVVAGYLTGFVGMLVLALFRNEPFPSRHFLLWAVAGGLAGSIGLTAFYRCLAVGKMEINAPLSALITAMIPVGFGIVLHGRPRLLQLIGFAIAIAGTVLVSKPEVAHQAPAGVGLAVLAGFGFGGFLICMKLASVTSILWPLCIARFTSASAILAVCLLTRQSPLVPARLLPLAAFTGMLDTAGNALFMIAAQIGRLDVAAVLSSLYPVTTVILARWILKERLHRIQTVGMLAVLVAIPLIAA
jgi:drug/metabolite transporter (DMT)-like permease